MDVTVVIPLYNGMPWIEETLASIDAQTHPPREILVVDDGSSDGSKSVVQACPQAEWMENSGDGAGAARHEGLTHARTPLVAFLDQDDLWHPEHLRHLAALLGAHDDAPGAMAQPSPFQVPGGAPDYRRPDADPYRMDPWDRFPLNSIASPSCMLLRRRALQAIGGWPHRYRTSDFHAWFKLTVDAPFAVSEWATVGKRAHDANTHMAFRRQPVSYMRDRVAACRDALQFRRARRPGEAHRYAARLDALEAVGAVLGGALRGVNERVAAGAEQLEACMVDPEMLMELVHFGTFMFEPSMAADRTHERAFLQTLVQAWPAGCPSARDAVVAGVARTVFSGWSFASCLARHPVHGMAWRLAREAGAVRMARRGADNA